MNNAGHGYRAAVEEGEDTAVRELFDTNVFGAVALIQAVLPGMRERGLGTIVRVSSIAARGAAPDSGFQAATKAALEQISVALRAAAAPLGIGVIVVKPGAFRTDFRGQVPHPVGTSVPCIRGQRSAPKTVLRCRPSAECGSVVAGHRTRSRLAPSGVTVDTSGVETYR